MTVIVGHSFEFQKRSQLFIRSHNEALTVAAMCVSNEESFSLAIRQQGRLLEHPEDFEDDNDNDNYSDYVENVSVHAGTHIKSGVRWPAFIQIERAIAISKSSELNPDCLATQKPLRGEARRLIARLGCVIDPAALRIVENDFAGVTSPSRPLRCQEMSHSH